MSIQPLEGANPLTKSRLARFADIAMRILAVAIGYTIVSRLLSFSIPSFSSTYLQALLIDLITGGVSALVLLPLARRLPYRMWVRIIALFLPLYWIAVYGNIVEAYFYTTYSPVLLTIGALFQAIPRLVTCWLIAWLFPAYEQGQSEPGIWHTLGQRPLLSWIWRIVLAGLLYLFFLQLFGNLLHPIIGKYYSDPTFMAQSHTTTQPSSISNPEEAGRGIVFALVLLPVIAVMRGRSRSQLLALALYIALVGAAFESWLAMLAQTSWPLEFRLGEGLDLTLDAIARGVFIALLLALPALISQRPPVANA